MVTFPIMLQRPKLSTILLRKFFKIKKVIKFESLTAIDRETRHSDFKYFRFGEVDKLEFLTNKDSPAGATAVVSFLSLQIAAKIHKMVHKMSNNALSTRYHDFSSSIVDPKAEAGAKEKRPRESENFHR